jgi:hypothetical protein
MRPTFFLLPILATLLPAQTATLTPAERDFQASMTGVVLEGQSTHEGKPGVSDDKYTIEKVEKKSGAIWIIHARVQYQKRDVTIPFPAEVRWAGDTPVIMLTDQTLPGMGTYTARVLIYQGHYAGTWSGKKGGGKVFGRVVKQ